MNYLERQSFSKLMLDNVIAAYEKSRLGLILKAPFFSGGAEDWADQLKMLRYLQTKLDFNDELNFEKNWFVEDCAKAWRQNNSGEKSGEGPGEKPVGEKSEKFTGDEPLVERNFFQSLEELAEMVFKHTGSGSGSGGGSSGKKVIYQDLKERYMNVVEKSFKKEMEGKGLPVEQVYAVLFECKTQELSFVL